MPQFPKKEAPKDARKAYEKALKGGASPSDLKAGAMRYSAQMEAEGRLPRFIRSRKNWLDGGCWEDKPAEHWPGRPNGRGSSLSGGLDFAERRAEAIDAGEWQ